MPSKQMDDWVSEGHACSPIDAFWTDQQKNKAKIDSGAFIQTRDEICAPNVCGFDIKNQGILYLASPDDFGGNPCGYPRGYDKRLATGYVWNSQGAAPWPGPGANKTDYLTAKLAKQSQASTSSLYIYLGIGAAVTAAIVFRTYKKRKRAALGLTVEDTEKTKLKMLKEVLKTIK